MWDVVRNLVTDGSTVLLTTQYLDEADALADEITVIDHGRVIAHDTPDGLKRSCGIGLIRVAKPHKFLDPAHRPLIAVKLHVLTRKSLGGIRTELNGQALAPAGAPIPGLYAVGEASGFGGGGIHGYRALEGTFLGGCLFTGRQAGRHIAGIL